MPDQVLQIPITFDAKFIQDYASRLVDKPEVAIVELISNCSDAGASEVEITWPDKQHDDFLIRDNGTGMTFEEFTRIWNTLSYNRREHGKGIQFPPGFEAKNRKLYGKNGKGRFSLFCFDDKYTVETCKDGKRSVFEVQRQPERRMEPIKIRLLEQSKCSAESHGTTISSNAFRNYIEIDTLVDVIGCKFIADPSMIVSVNEKPVSLIDLNGVDRDTVVTPAGEIAVYKLDSGLPGRTSQQHGVAWHVHNKGVGQIGWRDPNRLYTLDARTAEAKRITFIVVADVLEEYVNADWTGFLEHRKCTQSLELVSGHIQARLDEEFYAKRQEHKIAALRANRSRLEALPESSNSRIEQYIDNLQRKVRTLDPKTLIAIVNVLTTLEGASTGYELLYRLAGAESNDLDSLTKIMRSWSLRDAEIVLEELGRRLKLIEKLEELVDKDVDELHVIHPLIEQGLWIFGPQYEGVSYISNKGLRRVFRELLGDHKTFLDTPRIRPDIVALTDVFSRDSYDDDGEVNGLEKVLILELKRGGSEVKESEMQDLVKYSLKINKSGNLVPTGKIVGYLLGSTLGEDTQYPITRGQDDRIRVEARTYQTVIRQAKARTFNLKYKIEQAKRST